MVTVLAIDPGSNFGYAVFEGNIRTCSGDFAGMLWDEFTPTTHLTELTKIVGAIDPSVVVIEDVVKGSNTMKNWQGVWSTVGVQYLAYQLVPLGAKYYPLSAMTLKAYLRRQLGLPGKSKVEKRQIIAYINEKYGLQLKQKDHNQADAIALAECYLAQQAAEGAV